MSMSIQTKNTYLKTTKNINQLILVGPSVVSESVDCNSRQANFIKAKQIKFLKRFEEIFRKQFLEKEKKEARREERSQFQYTNRLKGMFILKKRSDFSECRVNRKQSRIYQEEEDPDQRHPIQGKSLQSCQEVSPTKKTKQKKQIDFKVKQTKSGKLFTTTFLPPRRPITQLDVSKIKIFNYQKIISIILKANKVSLNVALGGTVFAYFNVYIEEGNNSQMIKAAIRKRSGWRVVEMPAVAHMIWSQYYRPRYDYKFNQRRRQNSETISHKQASQTAKQSFYNNTQHTLSPLDDSPISPFTRTKNILQHRKSLEQNVNCISLEQYNRQVHKLSPHLEYLKRSPTIELNCNNSCYFYNHIPNNHCITDKKHLLHNLKKLYDGQSRNVFEIIPYSFEIFLGDAEEIWERSIQRDQELYWIVKPGEDSNRGRGITICKGSKAVIEELANRKKKSLQSGEEIKKKKKSQSYIIQKYLSPLLYNGRKFDIRMYMLVTLVNKKIRGYLYEQGYLRTSSKPFTFQNFNKFIHLTNDAIQTKCSDYGKYQEGNKLNWRKFQSWLQEEGHKQYFSVFDKKTKEICKNTLKSIRNKFVREHQKKHMKIRRKSSLSRSQVYNELNQSNRIYFQVFGLDFLIDKSMNLWLIEVNTNPALTTDCSRVVHTLIPKMIDNAFTIAVEPYGKTSKQSDSYKFQNKFCVIYDDQWEDCAQ